MFGRGYGYVCPKDDSLFGFNQPLKFLAAIRLMLVAVLFFTPLYAAFGDDLLSLADRHFQSKNYVKASQLYERGLDAGEGTSEGRAGAFFRMGQCYHYLNSPDSALVSFKRVTESYPTSSFADISKKWVGDCNVLRANFDTAVYIFRELARGASDTAVRILSQFEAGRALFMKKDYSSALSEFTHFLELYPTHPQARQAKMYMRRLERIKG